MLSLNCVRIYRVSQISASNFHRICVKILSSTAPSILRSPRLTFPQVGDRVGMMLKSGGLLHFYINGRDQGMAAVCPNGPYWGVVDLYGMTVKVTVLQPPLPTPRLAMSPASSAESRLFDEAAVGAIGGRVVRRESGLSEDEGEFRCSTCLPQLSHPHAFHRQLQTVRR